MRKLAITWGENHGNMPKYGEFLLPWPAPGGGGGCVGLKIGEICENYVKYVKICEIVKIREICELG